jgi:lipoate-protein ligase A
MINVDMETLGLALGISNPEKFLGNLCEFLPNEVSIHEIKKIVEKGFEKTFDMKLEKGSLTSKERFIAKKLYEIKYSQTSWNHGKTKNLSI